MKDFILALIAFFQHFSKNKDHKVANKVVKWLDVIKRGTDSEIATIIVSATPNKVDDFILHSFNSVLEATIESLREHYGLQVNDSLPLHQKARYILDHVPAEVRANELKNVASATILKTSDVIKDRYISDTYAQIAYATHKSKTTKI